MASLRGNGTVSNRFNCRFVVLSGGTSSCFAGWAGFKKAPLFAGQRDTGPLFHSSGFLFHVHGFVTGLAQQCYLCLNFRRA
jgi:hypothetical protein